ncbi:cysteine-rich VLP domain-containing protein [Paenibacillus sp. TRM 82003]|nr:cysteine-rich VLP domain-containing protein [Paenibacillus sp. TRM 82003]
MDSYTVKDCANCDGHGVLFLDDGAEPECPVCEGEGVEYEESQ